MGAGARASDAIGIAKAKRGVKTDKMHTIEMEAFILLESQSGPIYLIFLELDIRFSGTGTAVKACEHAPELRRGYEGNGVLYICSFVLIPNSPERVHHC